MKTKNEHSPGGGKCGSYFKPAATEWLKLKPMQGMRGAVELIENTHLQFNKSNLIMIIQNKI